MALKLVSHEYCPCRDEKVAQYILDSASDAANLPDSCTGSTAMVAASGGEMYMVNASGEWKELASGGGGGSSGGGGTKFDVCAITFTTDGEEYHIHGPVADKDGNVVSIDTVVENGATYYLPSFSYVVIETCAMGEGNGADCVVESDAVINQNLGNLITVYIFAEPSSTGTAALKSEIVW